MRNAKESRCVAAHIGKRKKRKLVFDFTGKINKYKRLHWNRRVTLQVYFNERNNHVFLD